MRGQEVPNVRVNGIMMDVPVPAGDSDVVFKFDPISVKVCAVISLLTLVSLLVGWLVSRLKPTIQPTNKPTNVPTFTQRA